MELSQTDREKIAAYINAKTEGQIQCPVCKKYEWVVGSHLVQPMTVGQDGGVQIGGVGYPQAMLISVPCGYTMFINAVMAGLLPSNPPEKT